MGFRDGFAQSIDLDHQFDLVVHILGPLRNVKRMLVAQDGALWLQKHHRFSRRLVAQFSSVVGVVAPNANDFHGWNQSFTKNDTSTRLSKAPLLVARSSPK